MTLKNFAHYAVDTGLIDNVLFVDDEVVSELVWPEGTSVVELPESVIGGEWSTCGTGWSYINGKFVEPAKPVVELVVDQPVTQGVQTL